MAARRREGHQGLACSPPLPQRACAYVIESYKAKDKLYFIEYGRRAASLPAANDLVIRHCGKKRKVNDLADHNQFPMRLFGNNVDAKRGSWALLKPQPKPQLAAQPAQKGKGKGKR